MAEDKIIPEIQFPMLPDDIDDGLKRYLTELEHVLRDSLRGSMWIS